MGSRESMKVAWWFACLCAGPSLASACSSNGWDGVTTAGSPAQMLTVGSPTSATPVPRYSGPCAAVAKAPGNFVTDTLTNSDWAYHARFYAFVDVPGGDIEFFRASNASSPSLSRSV